MYIYKMRSNLCLQQRADCFLSNLNIFCYMFHNHFLCQHFRYAKAKESIKPDSQMNMYQKMTPAQDKTLWSGLVSHLKKNNLLPVVAFTFSRQKCDNNATNLTNLDLTTQKEKAHITLSFNRWIR